jgi:hypothetical protein
MKTHYYDPLFDENPQTVKALLTTVVFYGSYLLGHRIAGLRPFLALHSQSLPISMLARTAVVVTAATATQMYSYPLFSRFLRERRRVPKKEKVRRGILTVLSFAVLEQLAFPGVSIMKTALPSSVITTGSYAAVLGHIPSTSSIATPYQRSLIQRLGSLHGCHHCGSRQLFSRGKYFIADHMPPSKLAKLANQSWWRRLLKLPVVQCLRPQCMDCFGVQGNAVMKNVHVPVFRHGPRLVLLAPLLGTWAVENAYFGKTAKKWTNPLVDAFIHLSRSVEEKSS